MTDTTATSLVQAIIIVIAKEVRHTRSILCMSLLTENYIFRLMGSTYLENHKCSYDFTGYSESQFLCSLKDLSTIY